LVIRGFKKAIESPSFLPQDEELLSPDGWHILLRIRPEVAFLRQKIPCFRPGSPYPRFWPVSTTSMKCNPK
jgi:hypothetical protein